MQQAFSIPPSFTIFSRAYVRRESLNQVLFFYNYTLFFIIHQQQYDFHPLILQAEHGEIVELRRFAYEFIDPLKHTLQYAFRFSI